MLRDLILWWMAQMRSLLPRSLFAGTGSRNALLITAAESHVTLAERRRGRERELGSATLDQAGLASVLAALRRRPRRTVLRIAGKFLLERPVTLPLAAERDLDRVLAYDMDRLTPFAASDVVWQAVDTQRDATQRRLRLRLALVPRRAFESVLDALTHASVAADWLEVVAADGTLRTFPLSSAATGRSGTRSRKVLASLATILALAVIATPFATQTLALDATNRAIADLSPRVAQVQRLRRHLAADAAGTDALAAERARTGDVLRILAAVTDVMPDGTWLSELSLHHGQLRIRGLSPSAAHLIPALAEDPDFRNPAFAAPVTRGPDGHTDMFTITAGAGS